MEAVLTGALAENRQSVLSEKRKENVFRTEARDRPRRVNDERLLAVEEEMPSVCGRSVRLGKRRKKKLWGRSSWRARKIHYVIGRIAIGNAPG